ncbi:hypothetical protein TSAR_012817 [Trichomalopsis sarcophagae]|uniref:Uncharacterized protein n=1 Tax=Trichomalopsis sarcophagae TaxID=543379 RepID=A0A232F358_9HYME|nr:hypothetical protein TSAR_012817 [Trichomalopsis sarcophagae]
MKIIKRLQMFVHLTRDEGTVGDTSISDDDTEKSTDSEDYNDCDVFQSSLFKMSNLNDFMIHEKFLQTISTPVNQSPGELFIMLIEFALSHKLPLNAISSLFHLINTMFTEQILPETSYLLDKLLNSNVNIEFHGICQKCNRYIGQINPSKKIVKYIGQINPSKKIVKCDICLFDIDISKPSLENIFIIIDPSAEISSLINANDNFYDFVMTKRKQNGVITDIFDGKCYKSFVQSLPTHEKTS